MIMRLAIGLALLLAACATADEPVAGPEPAEIVAIFDSTGGCAMAGPNCTRLIVMGDGTVEVQRLLPGGEDLVDTASIDSELVAQLHSIVAVTDLEALLGRLPEGHCQGCFDGIDTTMTLNGADGPVVFNSVDVELDVSEPVFGAAWAVHEAARAVVEVPFVAR